MSSIAAPPPPLPPLGRGSGVSAALVASGILVSRLFGLVRIRVFSSYFGLTDDADAFLAAFRIPNFLQNLLGETALSASFIPVYARLVAEEDLDAAGRVAGAVFGLLALSLSVLVLVGVLAAPLFIDVVAPGFSGAKRDLTIRLVRILFPGAALLVLAAWCLGVLNSHRRFFLSYSAPVLWNVAMIATLVAFGGSRSLERLAVLVAWGAVVGAGLQFAVQLQAVLRVVRRLRLSADALSDSVRTVLRNFVPISFSRGVTQISAYVDTVIASYLPGGAMAAITNAQLLYTLPVSLFGLSVSAAELPAMSSAIGSEGGVREDIRQRLDIGLARIAFFVVPSATAFVALGDMVGAAVLVTGRFTYDDAVYVWAILAAAGMGLLASTLGRLYAATYYALGDTRTPLGYALIRVGLAAGLGYFGALKLPPAANLDLRWGAAVLGLSAGAAAWTEFLLLRWTMNRRIGRTGIPAALSVRLWGAAVMAAGCGWLVKLAAGRDRPSLTGLLVLGTFGVTYLAGTIALRVPLGRALLTSLRGRLRP